MTKQERTKIKKTSKTLYSIGYSLAIFGVIMLIIFITTDIITHLGNTFGGSETMVFGFYVLLVIFPLFLSYFIVSTGSVKIRELKEYKFELLEQQNKFHMKLFWEAIRREDFEEAKRLYNIEEFIRGNERVLCNGILMGIATQIPIDNDWSKKVDDRMNSYFL